MSDFMEKENSITQLFPEEYFDEIKNQKKESGLVHATTNQGMNFNHKCPPVIETAIKGFHYIKRKPKGVSVCRYDNLCNFDVKIPKLRIIVKK